MERYFLRIPKAASLLAYVLAVSIVALAIGSPGAAWAGDPNPPPVPPPTIPPPIVPPPSGGSQPVVQWSRSLGWVSPAQPVIQLPSSTAQILPQPVQFRTFFAPFPMPPSANVQIRFPQIPAQRLLIEDWNPDLLKIQMDFIFREMHRALMTSVAPDIPGMYFTFPSRNTVLGHFCSGDCRPKQVRVYVTDFGIEQSKPGLRLGADFRYAKASVFPELPRQAQILIPMPRNYEKMSGAEFQRMVWDAAARRINEGMNLGIDTFEIQLVQDINLLPGYFSSSRQNLVSQFGADAYTGLGKVVEGLQRNGVDVFAYAYCGSNCTEVLAKNVSHWESWLRGGASLFDGRASEVETAKVLDALGANRVRIYNTARDAPAPWSQFLWIQPSIGNADVVKHLKSQEKYADLQVFYLTSIDRGLLSIDHLAGMHQDRKFNVAVGGKGSPTVVEMSGRDLLLSPMTSNPMMAPGSVPRNWEIGLGTQNNLPGIQVGGSAISFLSDSMGSRNITNYFNSASLANTLVDRFSTYSDLYRPMPVYIPPSYQPPIYNPSPIYNPPIYNPPIYNLPPIYNPPIYNPPIYNPPIYEPPRIP